MKSVEEFVQKEFLLTLFTIFLLIVAILSPKPIDFYLKSIDFKTISTLFALLMITTGFKDSNYFDRVAWRALKRLKYERQVAIFMVLLSVALSTVLTNDITLFIVVPITLSLNNLIENDLKVLLVLEAIGVNAGSLLTPIGNPQNIYLWHLWGIDFHQFIVKMLPLFAFMVLGILFMTAFTFYREIIVIKGDVQEPEYRGGVFYLSLVLMFGFLVSLFVREYFVVSIVVFLLYLFTFPSVLKHTDWLLLVLFGVIFMLFASISDIHSVNAFITSLPVHSRKDVFLFSAVLSQVISNVPAAVLSTRFHKDILAITYGVSVGGTGLIIGSIANLIVIRLSGIKGIIREFHKYSIPFFIFTLVLVYLFLSI